MATPSMEVEDLDLNADFVNLGLDDESLETWDNGDPVPKGVYPAEVKEAKRERSSKGNPMLVVKYKITGGGQEGRQLTDRYVEKLPANAPEKSVKGCKEKLKTVMTALNALEGGGYSVAGLVGRQCEIVVGEEIYNKTNEETMEVTKIPTSKIKAVRPPNNSKKGA